MSLVIGLGQLGGATKLARPLSSPENIIDKVGLGQVCKNVMARTIPWIKKKRLGDASVLAPHFSHLVVEAVFFLQTYPPNLPVGQISWNTASAPKLPCAG